MGKLILSIVNQDTFTILIILTWLEISPVSSSRRACFALSKLGLMLLTIFRGLGFIY